MAARIRKGDMVEVITGADKGRRGEVLQVMPKENRAVVRGVKIARHHKSRAAWANPAASSSRKRRSTSRI